MTPADVSTTVAFTLARYEGGALREVSDDVGAEEPLEIRVEGETLAIVMRTPGHDRELAAGFLLTEGIIETAEDLFDITTCVEAGEIGKGNALDVALRNPAKLERARQARQGVASASCGICGKQSIDAVLQKRPRVESALAVRASVLLALPGRLAAEQAGFQRSGGLHACALFDAQGSLLQIREDIGRHNALDKLVGWALLTGFGKMRESIVLLSGRVSFEMMQKAQAAGLPIVAAISAPSSLAVALARESGQTLAGFVRGETMNVYAGVERVLAEAGLSPSPTLPLSHSSPTPPPSSPPTT
jgi:FdhD protein